MSGAILQSAAVDSTCIAVCVSRLGPSLPPSWKLTPWCTARARRKITFSIIARTAASCMILGLPGAALAIDEAKVAGIVYHETSGLRPVAGSEDKFKEGREKIAQAAYKRDGQGMAKPYMPTAEELKFPPAKAAWDASQAAAKA